ncbi:Asp-tRNA(Asn)/Glu-tRNA(Gln) amidotransferase subunit GatC [Enorma massiliensis]|uniref:Asp-tRNA(Asn)/Glu-tRNA(Gln) amidotransferase subunit GatC n=1 Tax=Enorma massiliensis TaxID=1472761 RepID=UPI003AEFF3A5
MDPTFHPIGSLSNVMRDDAVDADRAFTIDEALGNAGSSRDRSFRVPSILGEEE